MRAFSLVVVFCLAVSIAAGHRTWKSSKGPVSGTLESSNPTGLCDTVKSEAGYFKIAGSKNKNYFYWFFESRNEPEKDPVILWMVSGICARCIALQCIASLPAPLLLFFLSILNFKFLFSSCLFF